MTYLFHSTSAGLGRIPTSVAPRLMLLVVLLAFPFSILHSPFSRVSAVEGTLELKADVASFSGTFTQAGNQPIRTAFGPLRLDYKSGYNNWTTGLLMREGDGNVTIGSNITSAGGFKFPDGTTQTTAVSATAGLAQGSIIFYDGAACPSGYAEVTGARGRVIIGLPAGGTLAGTLGSPLSDLGSQTHTHTGPSHTHSGGTHSHTVSHDNCIGDGGFTQTCGWNTGNPHTTSSSGTGTTGTAATSSIVPYIQLTACQKS